MTVVTNINRRLPREQLRSRIYASAIAEFRARGFANATVEAITIRAGVAKGTFFNFYKTKADVLAEYYWHVDARLAPLRLGLDADDPVNALARYAEAVERAFDDEGELLVDLLMETMRDDAMRAIDRESGGADAEQFEAFLRRARAAGTIRATVDPAVAAALILDIWSGSVGTWLAQRRRTSLAALFTAKITVAFAGIAPAGGVR
jgi:AcrR family transcriptional regulator